LLLSLLGAACTVDSVDPSQAVDTVVVTPSTITMVVGSTVSFQAEARDASGAVLDREAFWAADDPAVATVTDSGDVTARRAGVVQIAASIEGKSGIADITVTGVPVASVQVQPPNATLKVGRKRHLLGPATRFPWHRNDGSERVLEQQQRAGRERQLVRPCHGPFPGRDDHLGAERGSGWPGDGHRVGDFSGLRPCFPNEPLAQNR
jgi:hypothetical protein